MSKIINFIKNEAVLVIVTIAALISAFFNPPSAEYFKHIDFRVIAILFSLMAIVSGFQYLGIFKALAEVLSKRCKTKRGISFLLVFLCFFSSMLITNDVALITFVPFAITIISLTGMKEYSIYIIVLQTIAANLGSMATPIGNPQNLYLYTYYNMSNQEFYKTVIPITVISAAILLLLLLFIKNEPVNFIPGEVEFCPDKKLVIIYSCLLMLSLLSVAKLIDYRIVLLIVFISILIFDIKCFKSVDYGLLFTFIMFFIFVGNIKSIPQISDFLSGVLADREFLSSLIASQIISNVPAAILISGFTDNSKAVLSGVDIGGLGTLIASLASLISFKLYSKTDNRNTLKYLGIFTLMNIIFLIPLTLFALKAL